MEEYITTINSDDFINDAPHMSIQIPSELVQIFTNGSGRSEGAVRIISSLYYDVEDLFPSERPGTNE